MWDLISPAHGEIRKAVNLLQHYRQLAAVIVRLIPPQLTHQDDRAGETSFRLGDQVACVRQSDW